MAKSPSQIGIDDSWVDLQNPIGSLRARLRSYADPGYADFFRRTLPKESCEVFGVRVAAVRQTVKEAIKAGGEPFLNGLLFPTKKNSKLDFCEGRIAAAFLIGQLKISFDKRLDAITAFLPLVDSWCVCDSLCQSIKPKPFEKNDLWDYVGMCLTSKKTYDQRVGVVLMLKNFVDSIYIGEVLERVEDLAKRGIKEHTVSMGTAWLLCETFIKQPDATMRYLEQNSLDDATFNRALQKICESFRVDDATKREIREMKRVKNKS
ncbi:MAG: DNA alkylation repair protein [Thermoguttaceae bacterium]|nr:DNA alkylation repair protein [Thermoguttaceae bacterium]